MRKCKKGLECERERERERERSKEKIYENGEDRECIRDKIREGE